MAGASAQTVDEYIAGFPPEVADRLQQIRSVIVAAVREAHPDSPPEQKMRYGIAAIMLGGRYALHFAGWKKHIGLYPVPPLPDPLESQIAPYRSEKDSVTFLHTAPIPYELVASTARAIVRMRE